MKNYGSYMLHKKEEYLLTTFHNELEMKLSRERNVTQNLQTRFYGILLT